MTDERKKKFALIRSFALADFLTLGNAACGTASIFLCLNYLDVKYTPYLWFAIAALPVALVFDFLDGYVARWRRKQSPFGADLDSLADIISFGVAPAVLGFTLGLRGGWDTLILIYFVTCGIARLARFNVTAAALADESGKVKYYEGTPIPTSVLLVLILAVAFGNNAFGENLWFGGYRIGGWMFHPLSLMFAASGSAMISERLRIPKP